MEKERIVIFVDYANINRAARTKRFQLDYYDLLCYLEEGRFLIDAHCYVPINPRNEHRLDRDIEALWRAGYLVQTKVGTIAGGTYKCNFDVEITMDVLKVMYQVKPDIIVLATGDADFVPLMQEVRRSGIRVEIAAFEETLGAEMRLKCSGFINLELYYEDALVAENGGQREERTEEVYQDLIQAQEHDLQDALVDKEDETAAQEDEDTNMSPSEDANDSTSKDEMNV